MYLIIYSILILMMAHNYSNSTKDDIFDTIVSDCNTLLTVILYISMFSLCILSFIWSVYLILSVIKEKNNQKYLRYLKNSIQRHVWEVRMKNSERKMLLNTFLIAICIIEWVMMFSLSSLIIVFYTKGVVNSGNFDVYSPNFRNFFDDRMKDSFSGKFLSALCVTLFLLLITLLRLLTRYLCQEYDFFSDRTFKLCTTFKRKCLLLLSIFILGLFHHTIILQWIISCIVMSHEFVCYFKSTKLLTNLLYKRYFDARNHEYQPISVVRYYAWAYLEFKVGSCFVVTSFFFHLMSLIGFTVFSFLWFILSSPNKWMQVFVMNEYIQDFDSLPHRYQQQLHVFSEIYELMELFSLAFGWSLLVIPYLIISLKLTYNRFRSYLRQYGYQERELIQKLIERHNMDYYN